MWTNCDGTAPRLASILWERDSTRQSPRPGNPRAAGLRIAPTRPVNRWGRPSYFVVCRLRGALAGDIKRSSAPPNHHWTKPASRVDCGRGTICQDNCDDAFREPVRPKQELMIPFNTRKAIVLPNPNRV